MKIQDIQFFQAIPGAVLDNNAGGGGEFFYANVKYFILHISQSPFSSQKVSSNRKETCFRWPKHLCKSIYFGIVGIGIVYESITALMY